MASEAGRVAWALLAAAATSAATFVAVDFAFLLAEPSEGNTIDFLARSAAFLWTVAFVVAAIHAVVLGLPAILLLKRIGLTQWWVSLPGGFLVGALPNAVLSRPWHAPPPDLVAAHITPAFAWPHYAMINGALGFFGMAGGVAAWLVWNRLGRRNAAPVPTR